MEITNEPHRTNHFLETPEELCGTPMLKVWPAALTPRCRLGAVSWVPLQTCETRMPKHKLALQGFIFTRHDNSDGKQISFLVFKDLCEPHQTGPFESPPKHEVDIRIFQSPGKSVLFTWALLDSQLSP